MCRRNIRRDNNQEFSKIMTATKIQIQELQKTASRVNTKNTQTKIPRYIICELSKPNQCHCVRFTSAFFYTSTVEQPNVNHIQDLDLVRECKNVVFNFPDSGNQNTHWKGSNQAFEQQISVPTMQCTCKQFCFACGFFHVSYIQKYINMNKYKCIIYTGNYNFNFTNNYIYRQIDRQMEFLYLQLYICIYKL